MMPFQWQKMSPAEFHQLQEYLSYSSKTLKDVMEEFNAGGLLCRHKCRAFAMKFRSECNKQIRREGMLRTNASGTRRDTKGIMRPAACRPIRIRRQAAI
ncbi:hypothetical protein LSAT2_020742 [Lamellibrachia satsuma]|nr:hypothetical protein LSAT2_020742 [Lamellibrachia satsuma]